MQIVQCWDDGVTTDIPLLDILTRYNAKATFNLNAGLHCRQRRKHWSYCGQDVIRLGWDEMKNVYQHQKIGNHGLHHADLTQLEPEVALHEIADGQERLEQFFAERVVGYAYAFGAYSPEIMEAVARTGHKYGRTTATEAFSFPPGMPMAFHPTCHFLADHFWRSYDACRSVGVFYFWGHSYEILNQQMWDDFRQKIRRIAEDPETTWAYVEDVLATDQEAG